MNTWGGLGAIFLWSATFAFARSLSEQVGPLSGGASAYLIAGAFCLLRIACSPSPMTRWRQLPPGYLFGCGFLFVFYTAAVYLAVGLSRTREQLLEIALVNYLWPALTVLGSTLLLQKRASVWLAPGTALALSGVFLVMTQGAQLSKITLLEHVQSNPAAYAMAFLAAISWALYSNLTRRWTQAKNDGAVELFIPITGLVLLGLRYLLHESGHWNLRAAGEATTLAAITALAYFLWDASMRKGNLLLVAVFSYFTPLVSTLVSCAYLGVSPGPRLWLGCLLLVSGSLLTWKSVSEAPALNPPKVLRPEVLAD